MKLLAINLRGDVPDYDGHGGCRPILQLFHNLTEMVIESEETPSYTFRDPYFSYPLPAGIVLSVRVD